MGRKESLVSPLYLPYISPISHLYLAYISGEHDHGSQGEPHSGRWHAY